MWNYKQDMQQTLESNWCAFNLGLGFHQIKRKTLYIKIKDGNLAIKNTRQMKTHVNPKKKWKKIINEKWGKENLMQIGPKVMK